MKTFLPYSEPRCRGRLRAAFLLGTNCLDCLSDSFDSQRTLPCGKENVGPIEDRHELTNFRNHAADFLCVWYPPKVEQLSEPESLERLTRFAGNASSASNLLEADHLFLLRRCSHSGHDNAATPARFRIYKP